MGSIERFIGILIEHYSANFPLWLSPEQVRIIPISDRHSNYANEVALKFANTKISFSVDSKSESMQKKIRNAQNEKVNYMLVLGDREIKSGEVNVRSRNGENKNMKIEEFIEQASKEIDEKKNV